MTQTSVALGKAIRATRRSAGLTIAKTAEVAGISGPYLSNVENGNVLPSADWVRMVLTAIGSEMRAA